MEEQRQNDDLEAFIHAELRRLPKVPAPFCLRRRVLAAVVEEQANAARPWWERAWWEWPLPAKFPSLLLFLSLAAAVCALPWTIAGATPSGADRLLAVWEWLRPSVDVALSFLHALEALSLLVGQYPWVVALAVVAFSAYLFLVGVGTFYVRFAFLHASAAVRHGG